MTLVNEQEDYYRRTRDLIAATRPAPLNVADQMPATMIPQWHRGTPWGRDRARQFFEETEAKVQGGLAAAPNEQVRLMWLGTGLWYNLGFYEYFEKRYGAVFVWSIYLAIAADAYPTDPSHPGEDPVRTLAGRMTKIYAMLNTAPFNVEWFKAEAKRAGIDGVVSLTGGTEDDCRETFGQHYLVRRAFEDAGIPILRLGVDNADARSWDDDAIRARVGAFIENDILARPGQTERGS
jgi:benzoyl-CoA reductase/2-hydroxyglutaryl-CoA dehydratase subunit BcrC/BadD/HgdB